MKHEEWITGELESIRRAGLLRADPPEAGGPAGLNFSTNDYLDLAGHPDVVRAAEAAVREFGAGARAARLISGTLPIHRRLEEALAGYKGCPAGLLFGSGYLANVGTVPALVGRDDHVFVDRLIHASVIDAATLSRARLHRFQHNDVDHLAALLRRAPAGGRRLVITESVFSMEGDLAPLPALVETALEQGALVMVDEAHATGVFGPLGSGLIREHGLEDRVNVSMGTLSKALGGYGGFVCGSVPLREWLVNRARSFIYTTAPPPAVAGAALGALSVLRAQPDLGARLRERSAMFRRLLQEGGLDTLGSASPIVPVLVGETDAALQLARRLRTAGLVVPAIRPPTVPAGTARLRFSISLAHADEDLRRAAAIVVREASHHP
jgi:8-amino-7-oxononanoate synthase